MKIPIKILVADIPDLSDTVTWGDVISNWEAYAVEWNASGFSVAGGNAPILDMFGDEGISIKSVVKDLNDPKKLFTEFSRGFTVPASKTNNAIFKHYYNIDITNGLDPRELIPAKILMNNATYKVGNIQVEGVGMSGGQPLHYKIKFIGKLSELARNIGQDKLSSLDFSADNLSAFNAKTEFNDNSFRDILFPLAARSERFIYDSNYGTQSGTVSGGLNITASVVNVNKGNILQFGSDYYRVETIQSSVIGLVALDGSSTIGNGAKTLDIVSASIEGTNNIAYVNSYVDGVNGLTEQDTVGAMRVGRIIEAIEDRYGLNFTGAVDNDYITDLFLWLNKADKNRGEEPFSAFATSLTASSTLDFVDFNSKSIVFNGFPAQVRQRVRVKGTWTGDVVLKMILDGEVVKEINTSNTYTSQIFMGTNSGVLQIVAESTSSATVNVTVQLSQEIFDRDYYYGDGYRPTGVVTTVTGTAGVGTGGTYNITNHIPDLKVMDFLSMLFKMFNIVAEVDSSSNVTTKHFDHYMSEGTVKDFSQYIHSNAYEVNRPNVYSAMRFEWADAKTALEQGYIRVNGKQYGELGYEIVGDNGFRLSGTEYKLKVESQRIPLERLSDQVNNELTSINYCLFADLKGAEQQNKAGFTYVRRVTGTVDDESVAFRTGTGIFELDEYIQPSNTYAPAGAKPIKSNIKMGLFFGEEIDENNLYSSTQGLGLWKNFYRGITSMMFDENKRSARFDASIPQGVLSKLSLADTLSIFNDYYTINSIETNYLTGRSKLELTLVGNSKLPQLSLTQNSIQNQSSSEVLYITYMNADGEIIKASVAASATSDFYTVGGVISHSHDNFVVDGELIESEIDTGGGGTGGE